MIKLKELLFGKSDCGCNNTEGTILNEGVKISENLQYHLDNKIPLGESIFRISSNAHVKLFAETRKLWEADKIQLSEADEYYMHTDAGRQGMYEGKLVPLDLPYIMESSSGLNASRIIVKSMSPRFGTNGKRLAIDREDLQRLKSGKDIVGYSLKYAGQQEFILAKDKWEVEGPLNEAKNKKKKNPPLNKPKRGGPKAYYVYVRDPRTKKVKKVTFGSGGLKAKLGNKQASQAFAKRHDCKNKKDRTKASYWSCNLPRYHKQLGLATPASTFW